MICDKRPEKNEGATRAAPIGQFMSEANVTVH